MVSIFVGIAVFAGISAVGAFVGTSISNLLFGGKEDNNKSVNELKSEIHVMSNEVKGVNVLEVITISLIVFVITSIMIMGLIAFIVKRCKKSASVQTGTETEIVAQRAGGSTSPV